MVVLLIFLKKCVSLREIRCCINTKRQYARTKSLQALIRATKLSASTLIETLVASVIIITIFTIASLTLNNVFSSTVKNNADRIQNRINTVEYLFLNDKIAVPYQERFENWEIQLQKTTEKHHILYLLEAKQSNPSIKKKGKRILRKINYVPSP